MRVASRLWIACIGVSLGFSQDGKPTEPVKFDVASVKPATMITRMPVINDGGIDLQGITLHNMLMWAYDLKMWQVSGPESLRNRLDVVAKLPAGAGKDQWREMLRALLQERFLL